ncbi:pimeloyl-ACP methyl ester carboxylesterase [Devosia sp. UYZn731]|uniref:alpha/beta fold hydrolase n=1 Tax=Devosia sp. UYZn731 TaxID=3156345 RepID=UPI00339B8C2C
MNTQDISGDGVRVTISDDGTKIAYETRGAGPALVMVGGALNDRGSQRPYAEQLKSTFTVYTYDRRGRGDSGNTLPYGAKREVEDLAAVIQAAGGAAYVFGHSSGSFIGLLAAASGVPIMRLATYEPPYAADEAGDALNTQIMVTLEGLLEAGQSEEALAFFFSTTGMPPAVIEQQKHTPHWPALVAKAPTLIYDYKLKTACGDARVPTGELSQVAIPVQAMAGGASPDWMRASSRRVAYAVQHGTYLEVPGQGHMVPPEIVAPLLRAFFS